MRKSRTALVMLASGSPLSCRRSNLGGGVATFGVVRVNMNRHSASYHAEVSSCLLAADSPANNLRRISWVHSFLNLLSRFDFCDSQLESLLQVLPQLGRGAEVAGKT